MKIAFIGLGNMGSGMCRNLVKAGHEVQAYDINSEAVAKAAASGAIAAESIAGAAADANAVVTMLPTDDHVHAVLFSEHGVVKTAATSALFIDCSTVSVVGARNAASKAQAAGFAMVDAPVSGGVNAADKGTLTFMVGGAEGAVDRALPILDCMGTNIVRAGQAGNGQVAKIANNLLLGVSMIATSEAFILAEKLGLDKQTFFDIASNASGQNWSMTSYCPVPGPVPGSPSNYGYKPGFAVDMMLKDLRLAAGAAESCGAEATLGAKALSVYEKISEAGLGAKDFSVVAQSIS